ncbi:MAG: zinc-dependent alcohol dehydrogenase family protein [Chloroflexi bacterium]|nr:zinc-dependent alcohol dehydrogenase family protein [Chloroflexota bacterium]
MKAMLLTELGDMKSKPTPLSLHDVPDPIPGEGEVLVKVSTCGVCHTELDEIEGRTPPPKLPVILGHQVVGIVEEVGSSDFSRSKTAKAVTTGDRVGVAWIFSACGKCEHCKAGEENLCAQFRATGRDVDGGYAQYMTVPAEFAHPIPEALTDSEAAPLLCAGAIGYRSLRLANIHDGQSLGLTGFGGSNHLVLKMAKQLYPNTEVFVFTRNPEEQEFARSLGAAWAGGIEATSPQKLHAIIDTTPVWKPVVEALRNLDSGGRLVVNAIRKEEVDKDYLLKLDYPSHLWMEKEIKSVANVTRGDVREFLALAAESDIRPEYQEYALANANRALAELRQGQIRGAKVLVME